MFVLYVLLPLENIAAVREIISLWFILLYEKHQKYGFLSQGFVPKNDRIVSLEVSFLRQDCMYIEFKRWLEFK